MGGHARHGSCWSRGDTVACAAERSLIEAGETALRQTAVYLCAGLVNEYSSRVVVKLLRRLQTAGNRASLIDFVHHLVAAIHKPVLINSVD